MTFDEKLKKLRKQHGLSQEAFAEQLGITRQAVSKWESGGAYPEMDKLLLMCKIFNCTLEELTNDEISEITSSEDTTTKVKSFINKFLDNINKGIDTIKAMNSSDIKRMLLEMIILLIIINIIHYPLTYIFGKILWTSSNAGMFASFFRGCFILIEFIYFVFSVMLFLYIFKMRYMDESSVSKPNTNVKEEKNVETKETVAVEKQNRNLAQNIVGGFAKFILVCIAVPISFTIVGYAIALGIFIMLAIEGISLYGPIMLMISLIIITSSICKLLWNVVIGKSLHFHSLIASIIGFSIVFGIGTSVTMYEATGYTFYNRAPSNIDKVSIYKELTNDYSYYIDADYIYDISYVIDNNLINTTNIEVRYYNEYVNPAIKIKGNKIYIPYFSDSFSLSIVGLDLIKDNLKNKEIYNYVKLTEVEVVVTGNESIIRAIRENTSRHD